MRRSLIFYRNEIQKMTGKVSESLEVGLSVVMVGLDWSRAGSLWCCWQLPCTGLFAAMHMEKIL